MECTCAPQDLRQKSSIKLKFHHAASRFPLPLRHCSCCAHSPTALQLRLPSSIGFIFHSAVCAGTRFWQIENVSTLSNAYVYVVCRTRFFSRGVHSMTVSFISLLASAASIPSTGRFVYIRIPTHLWRHPIHPSSYHAHGPRKVPPSLHMYAETTERIPPFTHRIVRLFFQLPAFSTFGDRTLACRRYCKKLLSSLVLLSMCHWLSTSCFSRLSRFLFFVFCLSPAMGF